MEIQEPSVDEEMLSELFEMLDDGSSDGLLVACDLFVVGVPTRLAEIAGALAEGRPADAGKEAHALRGTAGAFGARRLGQLAGDLERVCGQADIASAGALAAEMQSEFVSFRTVLTSRLAALPSG